MNPALKPLVGLITLLPFALGSSVRAANDGHPDFDRTIAPLLSRHCLDCHSGQKPKGRLDLSRREKALAGGKSGAVLVPGKPQDSLLWEYVNEDKMPPKKPLSSVEKTLLRQWIAAGAAWGTDPIDPFRATTDKRAGYDWWSLQPVRKPALPATRSGWGRNPIDAFITGRLETTGLSPSPAADRRTLIRRLSFDLLGLPPSPEEVAAFENDSAPGAHERLVNRYLNSPHYGVRWARHWLDVVRFGESNGFEYDEFRPNAWPYRDWVVNAFNRDLPYDEFVRLQLAGDVLRPEDPDAIKATGFLVAGAYDTAGQKQQSEAMRRVVRQDELEDIVGTVGQTFLGLTVNCARCHDHKFDPVRQVEYYRLTAALDGVRHGERDLAPLDRSVIEAKHRAAELSAQIGAIERPVRERILAGRGTRPEKSPEPIARWDFDRGLADGVGRLHATLHGNARLVAGGLKVDGQGSYAATALLHRDLQAKTLEVWVTLSGLGQRGGAAVSVQTPDGNLFDAIVFGELEPGRWMAGSNGFVRTQCFNGPIETEADRRPVHLAVVYGEDGTITGYRDGRPYGHAYRSSGPLGFKAGQTQVVFGLRHAPAGGNKMLAGVIHRARLYDRALGPAEVAASAASAGDYIAPEAIAAGLTPAQKAQWDHLRARLAEQQALLALPPRKLYAVTPLEPGVTHLLVRGNAQQPAEVVAAGGVAALAGVPAEFGLRPDAPEGERRKRLAAWITDPRNPLTARVIVNRVWHYHFGVGLVDTPNDFGFNGGRPTHPELLDWLAADLVEHGWSLKHLHRLIVQSATYRQGSAFNATAARVDAGNRLLWRKSPLRLEAEMVRDAMLDVAGRLNPRLGGPGFQDFKMVAAPGTRANVFFPLDPVGPEFHRRTLYRAWVRGNRSGLLDTFDCPDPSTTAPSRATTTTPLQALAMLNNSLVLRLADDFADRLRREAGDQVERQVVRAYQLAYGRVPQPEELEFARRVVQKQGLAVLARAIFNSNEFLYAD